MKEENYKDFKAEDFISDGKSGKILKEAIDSPELLKKLLDENPGKERDINIAVEIIRELNAGWYKNPDMRKKTIWNRIISGRKQRLRLRFFRHAAAIFLFSVIGSLSVYLIYRKSEIEKYTFLKDTSLNDAVLMLADGNQIILEKEQSEIQYNAGGAGIIINDSSKIEQSVVTGAVNQIILPYGKRSRVKLSDGTVVWLNSGSKLAYAPVFTEKVRQLYLEGEAFFDVAKDPVKPFIVHTKAFDIQVVGTRFNVQSYSDDNEYNTVVINGKVSVNAIGQSTQDRIFLEPGQKAFLSMGETDLKVIPVENSIKYIDWINGYYSFDNESLSNVLKKISRYYNINIELQSRRDITKITGKLDLKEDPEQVLNGIAIISGTKLYWEDETLIIKSE